MHKQYWSYMYMIKAGYWLGEADPGNSWPHNPKPWAGPGNSCLHQIPLPEKPCHITNSAIKTA